MRECPMNKHGTGNGGNRAMYCLVAPLYRAAPRGATFYTSGGKNQLKAITSRPEQEDIPDVVTGII